jgi:hypothetical protein
MFCLNPQYLFNILWSALWCSPRTCPWSPHIYLLVSCAILLSTQNIFCLLTLKIARYISSATDSTFPQSDMDLTHSQCAADLILTKQKSRSTMLTVYCLNQSKRWDSYVLWPTLRLLLTVPCCYITPQLVLSKNMPHLPAVTLWLLMPVGGNTSNRNLQLYASGAFFSSDSLQLYFCTLASTVAYFIIQEASPWQPFYIHAFIGSKFYPSLIDNISLRILCHNIRNFTVFSIAGRNCPSCRHAIAANLVCSNIYITTYQICSCCMPTGRAVSACYGKQGEVSNIMAQNPQTNIINQWRIKFWSHESMNVKRLSGWCLLNYKVCNCRG